MELEQAIIILEDSAARAKSCDFLCKNKEDRIRYDERNKTYKACLEELRRLLNEDFDELDQMQKLYGGWWKL